MQINRLVYEHQVDMGKTMVASYDVNLVKLELCLPQFCFLCIFELYREIAQDMDIGSQIVVFDLCKSLQGVRHPCSSYALSLTLWTCRSSQTHSSFRSCDTPSFSFKYMCCSQVPVSTAGHSYHQDWRR